MIGSGNMAHDLGRIGSYELTVRARIIWNAIQRAHGAVGSPVDAATARGLRQQLATTDRVQMLDAVAQTRTAAQQPTPNPSLLRGMFFVLCESVQTLAAAGPAVTALKAAALPFGINL